MTWHLDDAVLTRWVDGTDGSTGAASVEQHLLACAECRAKVPAPPDLDDVWMRVRDELEAPRASWLERLLLKTGADPADARIVSVSPAFRAAWITGIVVVFAFVVTASMWGDARGEWIFVLVAPLVPAAAVALGYDPDVEPGIELETATPYSRSRLVLLRSLVLIVTGLPMLVGASFLVPQGISFLWLVPAAALTIGVLASSTWVAPLQAAGALGVSWLVLASAVGRTRSPEQALEGGFLAVYAVMAGVGVVVLLLRRGRFGETFGAAS